MNIYPAIDLIDGGIVRLAQGDFARETRYAPEAAAAVKDFADAGADCVHIVDLDGARAGEPRQHALFGKLAAAGKIAIQVAGGFRTSEDVGAVLDAGARRVVIGSLALNDPQSFTAILRRFGADRIVLALDVRLEGELPIVAGRGWQDSSGRSLGSVLADFSDVRHLLVTDIVRDGMLSGPNLALIESVSRAWPDIAVQASGGVAALGDLDALRATGAAAAIVGKALWEGAITLEDALERARG